MTTPRTWRCGECFAEVHHANPVHDCIPLPLETARVSTITWHYLTEPDTTDLYYATYRALKPCPFCGTQPSPPTTKLRVDNGMVQVHVSCLSCHAQVFSNGRTKTEAFTDAIRIWQDRRPAQERRRR